MPYHVIKAWHSVAALLLCLCLTALPVATAQGESVSSATVVAAPYSKASGSIDGMVRVFLSSLGNPTTLNLTIAGNYSLSTGTYLTNGETVTVGFSTSTGAITLTRNGTKTNMGTYFALRRHSATGTNGIRISQSRRPNNPYPGDISFRAVLQSSGTYKLYTIAHVYIEDYLYGVLPYEMGSSAPTEALKAQAVAARTYTVRMMNSRASGYYDVVDTTNDQVYNGTPSSNATCEAAVDATKGIVLKNGSAYTATYYSASNGGQTESIRNIWGTTGLDYLGVKDDPFDYANTDSVVKKATVYANVSSNSTALIALLKEKTVAALKASGYAATTSNTTLSTIQNIVAHTPMYASPSRIYTKLDFTLSATTANTAGASVTASTTITCMIFTELESILSMSIQSSKNELWTVTKSGSNFQLEARRFGHALGMSQRGAMYMGKLGYTYDRILGFYYEGSTRVGTTFTSSILASGSTDEITTEEPSATVNDTDDTNTATVSAVVKLVSSTASLAIRKSRDTSGVILGVVANQSPVKVYMRDGTWCLIGYGNIVGYVPTNSLTISGTPAISSTQTVTSIEGFGTVTANGYLNLRSQGSYSGTVLTTAPNGAILTVFSKSSGWAHVQYGATVAYASTDFLTLSSSYPGSAVTSGITSATVLAEEGGVAYLRQSAATDATVLAQLTAGTTVEVTSDDGSWAYLTYNGVSGYILTASLRYGDAVIGDGDTDASDTDDSQSAEPTAIVHVTAASLRVSADDSAAMLMSIPMGQSVVLISSSESWCVVRYEGVTGYVRTESLTLPATDSSTDTQWTTIVATQSGSLNLRSAAQAGSTILTTIPRLATVTVTSKGDTWSAVTYNGYSGHVMTVYLQFSDTEDVTDSDGATSDAQQTTATVTTASGSLNMRVEPKTGSTIVRTIPRGATVTVTQRGSEWSGVSYAGSSGYAMSVFLTFAEATATATESPETTLDPSATDATTENPDLDETVSPTADTATVSPETTGDAETVTLLATVSTASGSLNLRSDMLPGSRVLTRIPKGTIITIITKLEAWSQTTYLGYTGYVMNNYLMFATDSATDTTIIGTATVITSGGSLNLRASPNGSVLVTIPQNATVQVMQRGDTWSYIQYAGINGYAMSTYLSFQMLSETETTATATPNASAADTSAMTATVVTPSGSLNLRAQMSTDAQILAAIPRLTIVNVVEKGDPWSCVVYGTIQGYVQSAYLVFTDTATAQDATPSPTPSPTISSTETTSTSSTIAWVYTDSGSLNLRASSSTSSAALLSIPRLAQVVLVSYGSDWSYITYESVSGYVQSQFLTTTQPAELAQSTATTSTTATVAPIATEDPTMQVPLITLQAVISPENAATTLALWSQCSQETSAKLLDMLAGTQVQVLRRGDTWSEIVYYQLQGYCLTAGLSFLE